MQEKIKKWFKNNWFNLSIVAITTIIIGGTAGGLFYYRQNKLSANLSQSIINQNSDRELKQAKQELDILKAELESLKTERNSSGGGKTETNNQQVSGLSQKVSQLENMIKAQSQETAGQTKNNTIVSNNICAGTDISCGTPELGCFNCNSLDGYSGDSEPYPCTDGGKYCTCQDQSFSDYYCSNKTSCISNKTNTRVERINCKTAQEITDRISDAVVLVKSSGGTGSGFLIDTSYVLTNEHVVGNDSSVSVYIKNGVPVLGSIVGKDEYYDLALIKLEKGGFNYLMLGDSNKISIGQDVLAFGYPLDGVWGDTVTITSGLISSTKKFEDELTYFQTSALIHAGNSGGPLITRYGEVIGVNTKGIIDKGGYGSGIGFALPTKYVKLFLKELNTNF